jgi:hypothetical protein
MAEQVRRLQIHEVGERLQHIVDPGDRDAAVRFRFGLEHAIPHGSFRDPADELSRVVDKHVGDERIEVPARPTPDYLDGDLRPALTQRRLGDVGDVDDPGQQRDLLARQRARHPQAVPPLVHDPETIADPWAQAEPVGEPTADIAMRQAHLVGHAGALG